MTPSSHSQRRALHAKWIVSILSLACLVTAARGQAERSSHPVDPDSALSITLGRLGGSPLALEEAIRATLESFPEAISAGAGLEAARGALRKERGAFDPEIFARIDRIEEEAPTASVFAGAERLQTRTTSSLAGARLRLPTGTDLQASLAATRFSTNSAFASLDPEIRTWGKIEIRQPLLAGFGPAADRDLEGAGREYEAAQAAHADAIARIRSETEEIYWDLFAAERDLAVQLLILDQARSLLRETGLRAKAGLAGPNELANARVFVAEQEQAALDRTEALERISDRIAARMGRRPDAPHTRFRPVDPPPAIHPASPLESLLPEALSGNGAVRAARHRAERARVLARAAWWDALPAVDLYGSVGGSGLAGEGRDVVFGTDTLRTAIEGGFDDAWRQVRVGDYPVWSAGIEVRVPIGFRSGAGERERLRAEVVRAEQEAVSIERALTSEIRAAHREIENAVARLRAAREGVEASREQVRIGRIEYRNGRSTAFELVRLGADLAAAERRYSQALVRGAKAAAKLRHLAPGWSAEEEVR